MQHYIFLLVCIYVYTIYVYTKKKTFLTYFTLIDWLQMDTFISPKHNQIVKLIDYFFLQEILAKVQ